MTEEEFEWDHSDWDGRTEFWLSPDGTHLLTRYGERYTTEDLQVVKRITEPYMYVQATAMDADNNRMQVLEDDGRLLEYHLTSFELQAELATGQE